MMLMIFFTALNPQGEYQMYIRLNIIDDLERELSITVNCTLHVRNTEGESRDVQYVRAP